MNRKSLSSKGVTGNSFPSTMTMEAIDPILIKESERELYVVVVLINNNTRRDKRRVVFGYYFDFLSV